MNPDIAQGVILMFIGALGLTMIYFHRRWTREEREAYRIQRRREEIERRIYERELSRQ